MNNFNTFMGFGDVAIQSAAVPKPNVLDSISNVLTKVVAPAANIFTQIKSNSVSAPNGQQQSMSPFVTNQNQNNLPPEPDRDNTKKYMLIGGVGLLAVVGIYFATKKKGK